MDVDAILRRLITRELKDQGLAVVDRDPDLVVAYAAGVDMTTLDLVENPHNKMRILQSASIAALLHILVDTGTGYPDWVDRATGNLSSDTWKAPGKNGMHMRFRRCPASTPPTDHPRNRSWTGWSVRFLGCRARHDDAD